MSPAHGHRSSPRSRLAIGLAAIVGLAAGIGFSAAVWAGAPTTAASAAPATGESNLYVLDARSGSATRVGADSWRVSLSGASVLWFRDRPFRGSGSQSAASFVGRWDTNFAGSPPYAAVLAPAGPRGHHPTAVKLTDPAYDPGSGDTSVTLTPDKGESAADAAWLSELTPGTASTNGRVLLFIDNSSTSSSAQPTPEDESIVEYFNEIEFSDAIAIGVQDLGTQYQLELECPPAVNPDVPPADFLLTMYSPGGSSSTACNQGSILLAKAAVPQSSGCAAGGSTCTFNVVLSNRATGAIYCETEVTIALYSGIDTTMLPQLEPATLPIALPEPVFATGSVTGSAGNITLCDSPVSCVEPPTPPTSTYSYNSSIFFQQNGG